MRRGGAEGDGAERLRVHGAGGGITVYRGG